MATSTPSHPRGSVKRFCPDNSSISNASTPTSPSNEPICLVSALKHVNESTKVPACVKDVLNALVDELISVRKERDQLLKENLALRRKFGIPSELPISAIDSVTASDQPAESMMPMDPRSTSKDVRHDNDFRELEPPLAGSFPMCTDGQPPLMEANDAFPCARGCPVGFYCEMQDPQQTSMLGICCANRTALRLLYGDDNSKHSDPVWEQKQSLVKGPKTKILLKDVLQTALRAAKPSLQLLAVGTETISSVAHSNCSGNPKIEDSALPLTTSAPISDGDSVVISKDDVVSDAPLISVIADVETNNEKDLVTNFNSETSGSTTESPVEELSTYSEEGSGTAPTILDESPQTVTASLDDSLAAQDKATTVADKVETTTQSPDVKENAAPSAKLSSPEKPVEAVEISSTSNGSGLLTSEMPMFEGSGTDMVLDVETSTLVPTLYSESQLLEDDKSPEDSAGIAEVNGTAGETDDEHAEKVTEISSKNDHTEEDTLEVAHRKTFRFSCHSDTVVTQPTIRWYMNENGQCEFYAWGYCPGDRVMESTTIRTKIECERKCLAVQKSMKDDLNTEASSSTSAEAITDPDSPEENKDNELGPVERELSTQVPPYDSSNELAEVSSNSTLEVTKPESPSNVEEKLSEPAVQEPGPDDVSVSPIDTSTGDIAIENGVPENSENSENPESNTSQETSTILATKEEITPTTAVEGLSPEERTEVIDSTKDGGIASKKGCPHADSKLGNFSAVEEEGSGEIKDDSKDEKPSEMVVSENRTVAHDESGTTVNRTSDDGMQQRSKSGQVLCTATAYRYECKIGMPSQFVYRWEAEGGVCQSFPYGYCLHEFNHAHPRTREECERFCL
ncbi:hypothetical protein Q1695_003650 [Nippostrongylus brasiliensis]|nr:hypothetical protein Q1695_003650 [Nippostrongylus brasiliensis]